MASKSRRSTTTTGGIWFACFTLTCLTCLLSSCIESSSAAAVMSVDLGSEWMKVGIVSPGVPMEIALNRESKRKSPTLLAFRDGVRSFGEDAMSVGIKDPASSYGYLLDLLGKKIDNPIVDLYRQRFPYYDLIPDPQRNTVIFKKNDKEQFSVEELIAQMLVKATEFAEESTKQPITECVITVPGYFGQAEREALLAAAQLAQLKVLQLINDYTAVALNYGVFHRAEFNETAQYFIFYDMGAYKTSAALVSFQLLKDKHTKETNPVVQVHGVGYDRTLGGLEMQLRLRDYLAEEFNKLGKTKTDVTKNPRALAKLFKEAGRLKNVLSANNDHYAQIENLLEDHDFKIQVTREKLEELCAEMWPRVTKPLEDAIKASGLSLDVVSQVIFFGGGTRVPKVQELIKQAIKQEPGRSLNADEAATMGAVYKAADLATGFKVKKFVVKDAVIFPIQVSFERDLGDGQEVRQVKRQLFGHMNTYPQKKVITFNKHTTDFEFLVHYGDLGHLSEKEISYLGGTEILRVQLQKIHEMLEASKKDVVDSKGIKAYFSLDDSGIFRCTNVEYVYEKQKPVEEDEGTLAKLGSTISKLFSKEGEKKEGQVEQEQEHEHEPQPQEANEAKEANGEAEKKQPTNEALKNETKPDDKDAAKNETIKLVTVKQPVDHKFTVQFTLPLSGDAYQKSLDKLNEINSVERERNRLESAFNALESHVVEMQQKLGEKEYSSCLSSDERQKILDQCSEISNWLYEDHEQPTAAMYEKRLDELRKLTNVFLARHWEHEERPEALKALESMLDSARKFLDSAKNLTKDANPDKDIFTQVEIETLEKIMDETVSWKKTEVKAQQKLKRHEDVRLTVKDISDKMAQLDREVKYLVNKIKLWKPKTKPTKKSKKTKQDNNTESAANDTETVEEVPNNEEDGKVPPQFEIPLTQAPLDEDAGTTTATPVDKTTPHSEL